MKNRKLAVRWWMPALVGAAGLAACASTQPSMELVEARRQVNQVKHSGVQDVAPAQVLEAEQALERAEKSDDGSVEERHFAYLAKRKAQLARTQANILWAGETQKVAESRYLEEQVNRRAEAERELADLRGRRDELTQRLETLNEEMAALREQLEGRELAANQRMEFQQRSEELRKELEATQRELEAQREQFEQQQTQLSEQREQYEQQQSELEKQKQALEQERQARADAEDRARRALQSIEEVNVREEPDRFIVEVSGAVLFPFNRSELLPIARDHLKEVATAVTDILPQTGTIIVEGHTDSSGPDAYNLELSQRRAQTVMDFLVDAGVPRDRIEVKAKGETEPLTDNDTAEGRAMNRRVEIEIPKEQPPVS